MLFENVDLDDIAESFAHFSPFGVEPHAVRENRLRQIQTGREQKRPPVNRVKPQNILADQMRRVLPVFIKPLFSELP